MRDRLNTRVSKATKQLIAAREWLTVVLLPAYAPDLNPVEWVWVHVKHSVADLAAGTLDRLEALVRNRLESLQYRPSVLDGLIAGTGLAFDPEPPWQRMPCQAVQRWWVTMPDRNSDYVGSESSRTSLR